MVGSVLESTQLGRECLAAESLVVIPAALVGRQIQIQAYHRGVLWFERCQFLQVVGQCVERGRLLGHFGDALQSPFPVFGFFAYDPAFPGGVYVSC